MPQELSIADRVSWFDDQLQARRFGSILRFTTSGRAIVYTEDNGSTIDLAPEDLQKEPPL
jgi:hypothetical protein